jgi:dTDP-glucose pyrophosphorylase
VRAAVTDPDAYVVKPADSLRDAVLLMQETRRGLAVVTGDDGAVLGTVTDRGLRRAVLAGVDPDAPLADVLPGDDLVVGPEAPGGEGEARMAAAGASALAVVAGGRLVGIRPADGPGPGEGTLAVIMAGGRGQRLRPLTDKVPKPLLKVGTTSILDRLVASLAAAGVRDVALAVNYKAEVFEDRFGDGSAHGVRVRYLRERRKLGTAGPLSLLRSPPQEPFLVLNADMVTALDFARLLAYHRAEGAALTVGAFEHVVQVPYGVLDLEGGRLRGVREKPTHRWLCSAGVYVLEPEVLRLVPRNAPFDMPELIDATLGEGLPVAAFPILEKFFDIGSPEEFERVLIWFATGEEE